jgi:hypothetical protein
MCATVSWGAHESFMHPIFVLKNGCDNGNETKNGTQSNGSGTENGGAFVRPYLRNPVFDRDIPFFVPFFINPGLSMEAQFQEAELSAIQKQAHSSSSWVYSSCVYGRHVY